MYPKTISFLTLLFFIFLPPAIHSFTATNCSEEVTIVNEANSIYITIEVYENTAKIIVPPDIDIKIPRRNCIPVRITIDYKVTHTNLGDFRLAIRSPATTLVPVKIPPPTGFILTSQESSRTSSIVINRCIDGERLIAGNHNLHFALEKCSDDSACNSTDDLPPENTIDRNSASFLIYDLVDLGINSIYWIPNQDSDSFMLKYIISNMARDPINTTFKIKFYISKDNQLDDKDTLFTTKTIHSISNFNEVELNLQIPKEAHERLTNTYIICKLDADNEIEELNEENNISDYFITSYKDLKINSIEISRPSGTFGIYITCAVANKGQLPIAETTIVNLYDQNRRSESVLDSQKLLPVETNGVLKVTFYLDVNYYLTHIRDYILSIAADADNSITETNENNNEVKFKIPTIQNGETIRVYPIRSRLKTNKIITNKERYPSIVATSLKKVYPNPFREKINFSITATNKKSNISLTVYDTKGSIVDKTTSKTQSKGEQIFTYESINLPNGLYFYNLKIDEKSYQGHLLKK
ncbi:CARDB domain-containing protein [Aquimarina sp. RZ0]|uniref:CARDB domain-containing protein n=1 Tax=Aquimarina sp. RZ0 TaxID=2607730 RepID=UPI0011F3AEC5|nr:CARDB domain-containing protein [Aquimarina sp. RZ0]KAA1245064.1 T9SS type A sorting domain-containing protein [Aquimarina sp. RZ0]